MFEQSILFDGWAVKKTGAVAASLAGQLLGVGAIVLIPFIYTDRLPALAQSWFDPIPLAPIEPAPPPAPVRSPLRIRGPLRAFNHPPPSVTPLRPVLVEGPPAGIDMAPLLSGMPATLATTFLPPQILAPPPVRPPVIPTAPQQPVRVGGKVQEAKLIRKVIPQYPPLARQARVSGAVHLIGAIAKDGTIRDLRVESGHPLLIRAAMDAVRQWIYQPTSLNGELVEVIAPIEVIFTLSP